jgi:hypothetical protein
MDIVSFETAKRLKAAGFPHHCADFGQIWYELYSHTYREILIVSSSTRTINYAIGGVNLVFNDQIKEMVLFFAPTAADILQHIQRPVFLSFFKGKWRIMEIIDGGGSHVWAKAPTVAFLPVSESESPAEACAEAWLQLK